MATRQTTFEISDLDRQTPKFASQVVDRLLDSARSAGVSDIHLIPGDDAQGLRVLWRIDGVLHDVGAIEQAGPNVVARLKVLAELLTYRTDVPQEGRIRTGNQSIEMRVSTFPTLHGEKAVVRLFVGSGRYLYLEQLGMPAPIDLELSRWLDQTSGACLVTGPAGSGKTTTLYALLRHLLTMAPHPGSLCTLEDPIEAVVDGVAQSQVNPHSGFDYATGLKSLMRQDPDVIMVGEIRDRETAETVFQAALTGQLVLSSFHAATACKAIDRLVDLDIEPYLIRSGLLGVLSQRLLRRLCRCAAISRDDDQRCGLDVEQFSVPVGCDECGQTGYTGRTLVAEVLNTDSARIRAGITDRAPSEVLEQAATESGMVPLRVACLTAVGEGITSPAEVRRVLGFHMSGD